MFPSKPAVLLPWTFDCPPNEPWLALGEPAAPAAPAAPALDIADPTATVALCGPEAEGAAEGSAAAVRAMAWAVRDLAAATAV